MGVSFENLFENCLISYFSHTSYVLFQYFLQTVSFQIIFQMSQLWPIIWINWKKNDYFIFLNKQFDK